MSSRKILNWSFIIPVLMLKLGSAETAPKSQIPVVEFAANGKSKGIQMVDKIVKTDEEWRKQLGGEEFAVARKKGTERPFTSPLNKEKRAGVFRCVCCDTALFESGAKFDSGTGWPSFYQPIAKENVATEGDLTHGMIRNEVLCARCDAHLGHVFDDGPKPTGLRYCINGVSLKFEEKK